MGPTFYYYSAFFPLAVGTEFGPPRSSLGTHCIEEVAIVHTAAIDNGLLLSETNKNVRYNAFSQLFFLSSYCNSVVSLLRSLHDPRIKNVKKL
jgi:hypothetical protein